MFDFQYFGFNGFPKQGTQEKPKKTSTERELAGGWIGDETSVRIAVAGGEEMASDGSETALGSGIHLQVCSSLPFLSSSHDSISGHIKITMECNTAPEIFYYLDRTASLAQTSSIRVTIIRTPYPNTFHDSLSSAGFLTFYHILMQQVFPPGQHAWN